MKFIKLGTAILETSNLVLYKEYLDDEYLLVMCNATRCASQSYDDEDSLEEAFEYYVGLLCPESKL